MSPKLPLRPGFREFLGLRGVLEVRTVEEGLRPCGYSLVSDREVGSFWLELRRKGLHAEPVLLCAKVPGFLHAYVPPRPGEPYLLGMAYGRRREEVEALAEALRTADHATAGELLGYPECCVAAFLRRNTMDPLRELLAPAMPFATSPLFRYFGAGLILHFPCELSCARSRELARMHLLLLPREGLDFLLSQERVRVSILANGGMVVDAPSFVGYATTTPGEPLELEVVHFAH